MKKHLLLVLSLCLMATASFAHRRHCHKDVRDNGLIFELANAKFRGENFIRNVMTDQSTVREFINKEKFTDLSNIINDDAYISKSRRKALTSEYNAALRAGGRADGAFRNKLEKAVKAHYFSEYQRVKNLYDRVILQLIADNTLSRNLYLYRKLNRWERHSWRKCECRDNRSGRRFMRYVHNIRKAESKLDRMIESRMAMSSTSSRDMDDEDMEMEDTDVTTSILSNFADATTGIRSIHHVMRERKTGINDLLSVMLWSTPDELKGKK
jgi:hypothetical protein